MWVEGGRALRCNLSYLGSFFGIVVVVQEVVVGCSVYIPGINLQRCWGYEVECDTFRMQEYSDLFLESAVSGCILSYIYQKV